jgi:hypothetical protein
MNKFILFTAALISSALAQAQSFVTPIGFVDNDENRKSVIEFIKKQVSDDYTKIGMGDPSTLRMMEEENLKAFKELIKATNVSLLQKVIKTYCDIGMCNYTTILMMYKQEDKASKKSLEW